MWGPRGTGEQLFSIVTEEASTCGGAVGKELVGRKPFCTHPLHGKLGQDWDAHIS